MAIENHSDHEEVITFPSDLDTRLWVSFNCVQQAIYKSMDTAMKRHGLPPMKWYDVLWALERFEENGLRAYELEQDSLFEQSNLSRLLARMIKQGFIEEFRCPSDRRGRIYKITPEGKELRLKMWQVYGPLMHKHMERLAKNIPARQVADGLYAMMNDQSDID